MVYFCSDFFSRVLLCKSSVWSCPYTGQQSLTYQQALKSEEDFISTLNSIQTCHKKSILSIVHHSKHTNFNSLVKEVFLFFKERYIIDEELEYHTMNGNKRYKSSTYSKYMYMHIQCTCTRVHVLFHFTFSLQCT